MQKAYSLYSSLFMTLLGCGVEPTVPHFENESLHSEKDRLSIQSKLLGTTPDGKLEVFLTLSNNDTTGIFVSEDVTFIPRTLFYRGLKMGGGRSVVMCGCGQPEPNTFLLPEGQDVSWLVAVDPVPDWARSVKLVYGITGWSVDFDVPFYLRLEPSFEIHRW